MMDQGFLTREKKDIGAMAQREENKGREGRNTNRGLNNKEGMI